MLSPIGAVIVAIIAMAAVLAIRGGRFVGRSQSGKSVKEIRFVAGKHDEHEER